MGIGSQNAYIVKRKGIQFSRDPLNLVNLHSRKVRNRSHGSYGSKKNMDERKMMLTLFPARRLCQHQGMRAHYDSEDEDTTRGGDGIWGMR